MINRRGLLKLLGLAPMAAPIVAAGMPAASSNGLEGFIATLGQMTWTKSFDLEASEYVNIGFHDRPAIVVARIAGTPIYDPRSTVYGDVKVSEEFAAPHAPYHPELTAI